MKLNASSWSKDLHKEPFRVLLRHTTSAAPYPCIVFYATKKGSDLKRACVYPVSDAPVGDQVIAWLQEHKGPSLLVSIRMTPDGEFHVTYECGDPHPKSWEMDKFGTHREVVNCDFGKGSMVYKALLQMGLPDYGWLDPLPGEVK
jgi:hypothetical protein